MIPVNLVIMIDSGLTETQGKLAVFIYHCTYKHGRIGEHNGTWSEFSFFYFYNCLKNIHTHSLSILWLYSYLL